MFRSLISESSLPYPPVRSFAFRLSNFIVGEYLGSILPVKVKANLDLSGRKHDAGRFRVVGNGRQDVSSGLAPSLMFSRLSASSFSSSSCA